MIDKILIRPMAVEDIDQILEIERLSFSSPWSRFAFNSELTQNSYAHYIVLELDGVIVAYGGVWVVLEEGHITNVAVHPDYRGHGLGNLLMRAVMGQAKAHGSERITLELRASNISAQSLYLKFGFINRGLRKGYYTDNKEDAIIMWKDSLEDVGALRDGEFVD